MAVLSTVGSTSITSTLFGLDDAVDEDEDMVIVLSKPTANGSAALISGKAAAACRTLSSDSVGGAMLADGVTVVGAVVGAAAFWALARGASCTDNGACSKAARSSRISARLSAALHPHFAKVLSLSLEILT